eukprot:s140_g11.t1
MIPLRYRDHRRARGHGDHGAARHMAMVRVGCILPFVQHRRNLAVAADAALGSVEGHGGKHHGDLDPGLESLVCRGPLRATGAKAARTPDALC